MNYKELTGLIARNVSTFDEKKLLVFKYQYEHVTVYRQFCDGLGINPSIVGSKIENIPPIPIDVFKRRIVLSDEFSAQSCTFFQSSGTSKQERSKHYVSSLKHYQEWAWLWFKTVYPQNMPIYAYVPSYADNPHSSLISMLDFFVKQSMGSFLPVTETGIQEIPTDKPVMVFGAAFGLLTALENASHTLHPESILIETGGMKTFRKEISRTEMHSLLSKGFSIPVNQIHSEYGMAELMSQSYMTHQKKGFISPEWKQISIRNPKNPLEECSTEKKGQIAVFDLANVHSCSFILTEDEGIEHKDGSFSVLGRIKSAELRGCNFLLERD